MTTFNSIFFHSPSSFMMEMVILMHDYVLLFLLPILLLVLINIFYSFILGNFSQDFFEHHMLEFVWTMAPFVLLIFILLPSLFTLYLSDSCLFCGFSVSIMGHQWYWSYFYKDLFSMIFDSYMIPLDESSIRLLEVDNRLVLPSFFPLRFLVSSSDVIHSWTIPSFGVKFDAVPGRINQFCLTAKRSGIFFGQCSEICGANHSFMPISMEVIPFKKFF